MTRDFCLGIFIVPNLCLLFFFKKDLMYLFYRGEGRKKEREKNIHVWLLLTHPLLGTWPTTQAYALTGNRTISPVVHRPLLNPVSYTSQCCYIFLIVLFLKDFFWLRSKIYKENFSTFSWCMNMRMFQCLFQHYPLNLSHLTKVFPSVIISQFSEITSSRSPIQVSHHRTRLHSSLTHGTLLKFIQLLLTHLLLPQAVWDCQR